MIRHTLRVALVAAADENRRMAAAYLRAAGFDVHVYVDLALPSAFDALVWLADDRDDVAAQVRSWMRAQKALRVVVVTSKPAALRELAASHSPRLFVLAAPVFGWELVDKLRQGPAAGPSGASRR